MSHDIFIHLCNLFENLNYLSYLQKYHGVIQTTFNPTNKINKKKLEKYVEDKNGIKFTSKNRCKIL